MNPFELEYEVSPATAFLAQVMADNRLHEKECPAFSNAKGELAILASSLGERYCDCWISRRNPEQDPTKGYAIQQISSKDIHPQLFRSRAEAVDYLVENYQLSRAREDDNYWQKVHYVLEATVKAVEPPPSKFKIVSKRPFMYDWTGEKIHNSRQEAINELTQESVPYVDHPMADLYWGHKYEIKEIKPEGTNDTPTTQS